MGKLTKEQYIRMIPEMISKIKAYFPEDEIENDLELFTKELINGTDKEGACMLGGFAMGKGFTFKEIADLSEDVSNLSLEETIDIMNGETL